MTEWRPVLVGVSGWVAEVILGVVAVTGIRLAGGRGSGQYCGRSGRKSATSDSETSPVAKSTNCRWGYVETVTRQRVRPPAPSRLPRYVRSSPCLHAPQPLSQHPPPRPVRPHGAARLPASNYAQPRGHARRAHQAAEEAGPASRPHPRARLRPRGLVPHPAQARARCARAHRHPQSGTHHRVHPGSERRAEQAHTSPSQDRRNFWSSGS